MKKKASKGTIVFRVCVIAALLFSAYNSYMAKVDARKAYDIADLVFQRVNDDDYKMLTLAQVDGKFYCNEKTFKPFYSRDKFAVAVGLQPDVYEYKNGLPVRIISRSWIMLTLRTVSGLWGGNGFYGSDCAIESLNNPIVKTEVMNYWRRIFAWRHYLEERRRAHIEALADKES